MPHCYYCRRYFSLKDRAVDHTLQCHGAQLDQSGWSPAQAVYAADHNGDIHGSCMICGKPTPWNDATGKPRKMCDDPACRRRAKAIYDRNLFNARGMDQSTMMSDVHHQEELMKHRHIHGLYTFSDGGKVDYVGQLERNFLEFLDRVMDLRSNQILPSPEAFTYTDPKDGSSHSYIPDYFLPDWNLLVEIKDGGDHRNTNPAFLEETRYKVELKDEVMRKQTKYNYIRIGGTKYGPFLDTLYRIIHEGRDTETPKTRNNLIVISEAACADEPEPWIGGDNA